MKPKIPELIDAICAEQLKIIDSKEALESAFEEKFKFKTVGRREAFAECVPMLQQCVTFKDAWHVMKTINMMLKPKTRDMVWYHRNNSDMVNIQYGQFEVYKFLYETLHKNLTAYGNNRNCPVFEK